MIQGPERDGERLQFTLKELAAKLPGSGGMIQGRASMNPRGVGSAIAAHVVDIEVDPDTARSRSCATRPLRTWGVRFTRPTLKGRSRAGRHRAWA